MPGVRRLLLLVLVVPLLASCSEPWRAADGLMPTATPSAPAPSVVASSPAGPAAPEAVEAVSACSLTGVLITADRGDAAAGYREMGLHIRNCGTEPYELRGRPDIVVLDEDGRPLKISVEASRHYTAAPGRLVLKPGAGAMAVLSWRNTVTSISGGVDTGESLAVAVSEGGMRQLVTLPSTLDLGNTGRLETSAWF
ncbi:DUF4232 domain-containing protein [Actinoplanes sp. LDG1-06]|uniref:DUF4232 domain-containing protein n=1 Tax=Paractinoplanes ovalisporus TaxID=2810368 RepID=A0ABS2AH45_9ACTN|nr:DUF4232 domain-containing protein [Actinoplanes ovalisporus]MBM2618529.1 DUF4232 domain-containing protein [Actinoplanes ovalisporus]